MSVLLTLVGWLLVAGLALLVLAAILPVHLELLLTREERVRFSAALRPFGRFGPRIKMSGRKGAKPKEPKKTAARDKKTARTTSRTRDPRKLARAGLRLVTDLLGCVKIRSATIDGKFGLGDPGETGQMYGYLIPFIYGLPPIPPVQIDIEPAFDRAVLTGRLALDISLTPIRLLAPIARFGWAIMGSTR